jgi:tetrapyrrole methylase family protein/MazG family protein
MNDDTSKEEINLDDLRNLMAQLRGEQGCPWDRKQTLDSLKIYLL